jgi:hypothetical protein
MHFLRGDRPFHDESLNTSEQLATFRLNLCTALTGPMATKISLSSNSTSLTDNIFEALAPHISAGQIAILHDKIAKHFEALSVRNDVRREIGHLANTLCTIEENFSTIGRYLRRIDDNELVIVDGKPKVYATRWKELHEAFSLFHFLILF